MRLVLYTGKGGVGKTTTAAASAFLAAAEGKRTLLISADASHSLSDVLGQGQGQGRCQGWGKGSGTGTGTGKRQGERIGPKPIAVADNLMAVEVDVRAEMGRHWGKISDFLVLLFRYQGIEGVLAEELALLPGAEELTTLLAVDEFANSGEYDFAVVDCAPTDTTLRLLTLPDAAHSSLRLLLKIQRVLAGVVTPLVRNAVSVPLPTASVFAEAEELLYAKLRTLRARILDPQTSVRLVVTSEKMVIEESRRAFTDLCLFGLHCDAVVVNRLLPEIATQEPFFREWGEIQRERLVEISECFAPLRLLPAMLAEEEMIGPQSLLAHGGRVFVGCHPDDVLSRGRAIEFHCEQGRCSVSIPLPGATLDGVEMTRINGELLIRTPSVCRALRLPRRMAALEVSEAQLRDGLLSVFFQREPLQPVVDACNSESVAGSRPSDPEA